MISWIASYLTISVAYIPAVEAVTGLGDPLYIPISDADGGPELSPATTAVTSVADVQALLTGTQISAQAAEDLTAMLSQSPAPSRIYLSSYDVDASEDVQDALDAAVAADFDFGLIAIESRVSAVNSLVGAWLATEGRTVRHGAVLQSAATGLLTSGAPAELADCEVESVIVAFHDDDTEPLAAALCAKLSAFDMSRGPMALQQNLRGVALPTITGPQLAFLTDNNATTLLQRDRGATATARDTLGTLTYGGLGWTGVASTIYMTRLIRAAIVALAASHTIPGTPLLSTVVGRNEVRAAINAALAPAAAVGHTTPGRAGAPGQELDYPSGYGIEVRSVGSQIIAPTTLLVGAEARSVNIPITVLTVS